MSKYEQSLTPIHAFNDEQILSGKAQIDYINELEDLCKTCDRVIVHAVIARTAFSHRKYMEKFAARRGFAIKFIIKKNHFIFERVGENKANIPTEIILNQKRSNNVNGKSGKPGINTRRRGT